MVFISETYNTHTKDRLSAVIESDHIRYLVWNDERQIIKYDATSLAGFLDFLQTSDSLKQLHLSFASTPYHLLPQGLYEPGRDSIYLDALGGADTGNVAHSISIDFLRLKGSYRIPLDLITKIKSHVSEMSYSHIIETYLQIIRPQLFDLKFKGVMMHVLKYSALVVYVEGGKLKFSNLFKYRTAEDVLYYVLTVFKRFDQDPHQTPLVLSGDISAEGQLYKRLFDYIRFVDFLKTNDDLRFKQSGLDLKAYQLITLK